MLFFPSFYVILKKYVEITLISKGCQIKSKDPNFPKYVNTSNID